MNRILLPAVVFVALAACETAQDTVSPPVLADISAERSALNLVDRAAALDGAVDYDLASAGVVADLSDDGASMAFTAEGLVDTDGLPTERDADFAYSNIFAGAAALVFAESVRYAVIAPPHLAIAFAADGDIVQTEANVWVATNTVDLPEGPLTTTFTVAWVGVGWLGEMRYSDASHSNTLWFNGFISNDSNLGWWDLYADNGDAAVVEWISDGQGNGQFGIGVVSGAHEGSLISYTFAPDVDRIDFVDGDTGDSAYVLGNSDGSGEVQLHDHNDGQVACWDANNLNISCPAL